MPAAHIKDALPGEDLIAIEPELLQQVDAGWRQRLALFTGRALSDTALTNEQQYRAGRLALLGQAVTQGTVQGLDLSVDLSSADPVLLITPGYGISATGQDVTLMRALKTTLSGLAVIDGDTGAYVADFKAHTAPAQPWAGVLLLQAVVAAVPGSAVDTGTGNLVVSGNLDASCDQDPSEYAFGDSQLVDGARLVLATWPTAPKSLAMPSASPAANWRNRLVYTVFNAELALGPDDRLPWEFFGVPLALAGFDASGKLQFADRSAVVRTGGLPRRRYVVPAQGDQQGLRAAQPALANARVNQLAEQLGEILTPASPPGLIDGAFAFLPPSGVLPAYTMDFKNRVASWCPANWSVTAAPIFTEEMEGVLQTSITAAPLDTAGRETIEVLVPLPDAVYDPDVLVQETPNPAFQDEVDAGTLARDVVLQHQKLVAEEANALMAVLNEPAIDLDAGLTAAEIAGRDGPAVFVPDPNETFATVPSSGAIVSKDLQNLQITAAAAPYTVNYTVPAGTKSVPLFNSDDWNDLQTNGLQHFINRIYAKLDKANDLLDLAFLTAQTDIYRYRQNVLQTTDASRLAVSPILANIATGITAAATAQNIRNYLTSIATTPPPGTTAPPTTTTPRPVMATAPRALFGMPTVRMIVSPAALNLGKSAVAAKPTVATKLPTPSPGAKPGAVAPASPSDIKDQSPVVGAELDLRTLTIAERMAQSPAQEAMLYSVGNRVAFMQLLADLEITVDDLPIMTDSADEPYYVGDIRRFGDATRAQQVYQLVSNPQIITAAGFDPDEGLLFETGIRVLEQHSQLMRLVEARIQLYGDFLALCSTALTDVQSNLQSARTRLTALQNDLTQARQNLAFVQSLLADEIARVDNVNATRTSVLQTYVRFVAYARPRTVANAPDAPSRQLLPASKD